MNTRRIRVLKVIVLLFALLGIGFLLVPITTSLNPPSEADDKWFHELRVGDLADGNLRSFGFGQTKFLVYKRTDDDKLAFRSEHSGTKSEVSDFFVFRVHQWGGTTYVWEGHLVSRCGSFQYYKQIQLSEGATLQNRLICREDHSETILDHAMFVYDTAGSPFHAWMDPLRSENYSINRNGNLHVSW